MGTHYHLSGHVDLKPGTKLEELESFIALHFSDFGGAEMENLEIVGGETPTAVTICYGNSMSYGMAESLDDGFVALAAEFADFSKGPASATSSGDDYDDGALDWYVGPKNAVYQKHIADIDAKIAELQASKATLAKNAAIDADQFINTKDGLPEGENADEDEVCDECGNSIPQTGGSLANKHHKDSCSLYDPEGE